MDTSSSSSEIHRHRTDLGDQSFDQSVNEAIDEISSGFNRQLDLECNDDSNSELLPDAEVLNDDNEEENDDDDEDDDDDDDDFTFMFVGDVDSDDDKALEDGEIRQVFPLFDQKLLLGGDYNVEEIDRLPIRPPVDKIFIQSPRGFPSSENEENDDDATAGAFCDWSKRTATAELSKKSNSTGFSKLWRLKDIVGRSNSSGRDAFVFLKSSDRATVTAPAAVASSSSKAVAGDGMFNVAGGKARVVKQGVVKGRKATVSAHEAYLKSRGGKTEEERRRSYLPYRPELMGFFTNVHGGLTKNVHPY